MFGRNCLAFFLLAICSLAHAYPALLPYIYNPSNGVRHSGSESVFPQIEDDVDELAQLRSKRQHQGTNVSMTSTTTKGTIEKVATAPEHNIKEEQEPGLSHVNTIPDLERQLEVATPLMSTTTSTSATTAASKEEIERSQLEEPKSVTKPTTEPAAHAKAFYGAARLAFGQNPEVLPTPLTSTTTTTTTPSQPATTTTATTTAAPGAAAGVVPVRANVAGEPVETADAIAAETELIALTSAKTPKEQKQLSKETIGDILIEQLEAAAKTTERRSSMRQFPSKTAQSLLRNPKGQYSSFDMAQYVFWTGDETGVAKAVEELIAENLITREIALKFLRDIRLGIEFLQHSYANRIFTDDVRQNHLKRNVPPSTTSSMKTAAKLTGSTEPTTTTTTTTTDNPLPPEHLQRAAIPAMPQPSTVAKTLDNFTFWNKLRDLDNEGHQDLSEYDDTMGRAKIVEYLYNEYTLEEILYKLAKVMFAQSLAHGSDEAQQELQKLTDFLEHEGNLGVIPVDLQKKVLRVLLTALSDTLIDHPELLPAARLNLANPFYRLPMHTAGQSW